MALAHEPDERKENLERLVHDARTAIQSSMMLALSTLLRQTGRDAPLSEAIPSSEKPFLFQLTIGSLESAEEEAYAAAEARGREALCRITGIIYENFEMVLKVIIQATKNINDVHTSTFAQSSKEWAAAGGLRSILSPSTLAGPK